MTERDIPDPIKREVRQRCCFGCVKCGKPLLYEYDHIVPYAEVGEHDVENIVLLCDDHHREKTNGMLPVEDVLEAQREPVNCRAGPSASRELHYSGGDCVAVIGDLRHTWSPLPDGQATLPLIIDDTPIIGFKRQDDHLFLTVQLFNEENELVVQVADNELRYVARPWDVDFVGQRLTVRTGPGEILFQLRFEPPALFEIERATILRNGIRLEVGAEGIVTPLNNNTFHIWGDNCVMGLALGNVPPGGSVVHATPLRSEYNRVPKTEPQVMRILPQHLAQLNPDIEFLGEVSARIYSDEEAKDHDQEAFLEWTGTHGLGESSFVVSVNPPEGFYLVVFDPTGRAREYPWTGEPVELGDDQISYVLQSIDAEITYQGRSVRMGYPPGRQPAGRRGREATPGHRGRG